jgi:hypothetical protein
VACRKWVSSEYRRSTLMPYIVVEAVEFSKSLDADGTG